MNNKPRTIAGAFLISLISAAAGYFAGWNEKSPKIDQEEPPAHIRRAPQLTANRKTAAPPPSGDRPQPDTLDRDLGKILAAYSRMTPEQLEREINCWRNRPRNYGLSKKELTALQYLAYRWGQVSRRQAAEQLKNMGEFSNRIGKEIMLGWAEAQPEEASTYLAEHLENIPDARWLLLYFAREMAAASPENALKWISGFSGKEREETLQAFMKEIAASHPEQLQHYIGKLSREDTRDGFILSQCIDAADWESALRCINMQEDGPYKNGLRMRALRALSAVDFEKSMIEYQKLDEKSRENAAPEIMAGLAKNDPVAALDWLRQNYPEEEASRLMPGYGLFTNHFSNARIREYAENMADSPTRDSLLANLIAYETNLFNGRSYYTDKTLSLANDIKNPEKKKEALNDALQAWSFQYPEQAKSWLNAAPLSDELKQELRKELKRKSR